MPNIVESKVKNPKRLSKVCLKCGQTKSLEDFYGNKEYKAQLGKDAWCKSCFSKCTCKQDVAKYCWENNREWNEKMWADALKKAQFTLSTSDAYAKSSSDRQIMLAERLAVQQIPQLLALYYKYIDHGGKSYEDAKRDGELPPIKDSTEKIYSAEFNGEFTQRDLQYVEQYYGDLKSQYDLDTVNARDYAKQTAIASLMANKAREDYRAGRCSLQDMNDAMALFDRLSKSGCFSPSNRRKDKIAGLTSWGEAALKLETGGYGNMRRIEWPEDDVDRCINSLRHLSTSLGLDTM